MRGWSLVFS
jgi:hypothetical protein